MWLKSSTTPHCFAYLQYIPILITSISSLNQNKTNMLLKKIKNSEEKKNYELKPNIYFHRHLIIFYQNFWFFGTLGLSKTENIGKTENCI